MQATARPEANERWVTATRRNGQSHALERVICMPKTGRRTHSVAQHMALTHHTRIQIMSSMTRVGRRSLRMARMSCCLLIWMQPHVQILLSECVDQIDHTWPHFNGVVCLSGPGRQGSGRHRSTTPRKRRLGLVDCPLTPCPYRTGRVFPQCHHSPRPHGNAGVE